MRVAIIGLGFVGKALYSGFKKNVEVMKIDPKLGTSINDLINFNPEITFLCVPTPMNKDGSQNISILQNVIDEINSKSIESLFVLKSTVLPNHIKYLETSMKKFIYNPEFLREKHANEDFINSPLIVFGGKKDNGKYLARFYDIYTKCKCKDYIFVDAISASFIKYAINSFLATKVTFFNQLHDVYKESNTATSWEHFVDAIAKDKRIGDSHMDVPGHDGRKGYGGACFPKDTNAFLNYSKSLNKTFSLLNHSIEVNNKIRLSYKDLTDREKDQNINFEKKDL